MWKQLGLLLLLTLANTCMAESPLAHYLIRLENGAQFDCSFYSQTITWVSLAGDDKGQTETDTLQQATLPNKTQIYQWQERNGDFITLALDTTHHKLIASGKLHDGQNWLLAGSAESIT